jgi:hypothetical protein
MKHTPAKTEDVKVVAAQQLDTDIRNLARQAHIVLDALVALVAEAKASNIHETLGFPSWTAYLADALDGQWQLERDKRGEIVKYLAQQGMSQRAIAAVTNLSKSTVNRELAQVSQLGQLITGLDGKTYPRLDPPVPDGTPDEESTRLDPPVPDGTPDEESNDWLEREFPDVAAEVRDMEPGVPRTITIPDNIDDAMKRLIEIENRIDRADAAIQRGLQIKFELELAELLKNTPKGWKQDAQYVALYIRYQREILQIQYGRSGAESVAEFAETAGLSKCDMDLLLDIDDDDEGDVDDDDEDDE